MITQLPPAPQRSTDSPAVFVVRADNHVASLTQFVNEVNAEVLNINADSEATASSASDSADSATSAAISAASASDSADIAQSNANLKGNWVDLTGALNVPASVFHVNTFWALLVNLADVTLSEPGITADWVKIDTSAQITHNVVLHHYRSR